MVGNKQNAAPQNALAGVGRTTITNPERATTDMNITHKSCDVFSNLFIYTIIYSVCNTFLRFSSFKYKLLMYY
jgi:hypothetical protein